MALETQQKTRQHTYLIKAEANLLRLPIFALHTKGLRNLNGIECNGTLTREGQSHRYTFQTARSTRSTYPGPLSRSLHMAILSLITDRGLPFTNPFTWTWGKICRRLSVQYSGQMIVRMKQALLSTLGLTIYSQNALFSKPDGALIHTRESAMHLYDELVFVNDKLPSGEVADTNYLWFSRWYLDNLNAFFTAPLDYDLWQFLEKQSTIASRLYEFLLLKSYSGVRTLRINYRNLASFLPVTLEKYDSQAKQQLETAIPMLIHTDILDKATTWAKSRDQLLQLQFQLGRRFRMPSRQDHRATDVQEMEATEVLEVREVRDSSERLIVADFYRQWLGREMYSPTAKELSQAHELVQQHGAAKLRAVMPLMVKRMKEKWPDARTFGAIGTFVGEAIQEFEQEQARIEAERQQINALRQQGAQDAQREVAFREYSAIWETLGEEERQGIEEVVQREFAGGPLGRPGGPTVRRLCIYELMRRRGAG